MQRKAGTRYGLAAGLGLLAVGLQYLIRPLTNPDSYQILLGLVAISVIYGGRSSGLITLAVTAVGKVWLIMDPGLGFAAQGRVLISRIILYAAIGVVICSIGGQLHASRSTLAAVLAAMGDGVIASDAEGRVRFMNAAAAALTGWRQEEAEGRRLGEVARLSSGEAGGKWWLASRGGARIPVFASSTPIHDRGGALEGRVMLLRDMTERERLIERLEAALAKVKALSGLLPICASCKNIRDARGEWQPLESYIASHSEADFSHGICPECMRKLYPDMVDK